MICADEPRNWFVCEVTEMAELELSLEEFGERRERRRVAREAMVERRRHTRYAVDAWAEVLVKDGTMLFRGRVLDVSVGGCYVETEARLRLAPGTPVEMVLRVNDRVFQCDATIRMMRTKGAGFLFSNLDAKVRMELEGLIRELCGAGEE
jgi:PilZ domain